MDSDKSLEEEYKEYYKDLEIKKKQSSDRSRSKYKHEVVRRPSFSKLNELERSKKLDKHLKKRFREVYDSYLSQYREIFKQVHSFQY